MKVMKSVMSAGQRQKCRIDQRLLDAVAQIFRLHQVLDQARQNIGKRPARFARRDEVHVNRREDAGKISEGL
jgi:hypothetical protein